MDVEKLSLKPTEIDKNTGRIVLPKSQEELDQLSGRTSSGFHVQTRVKTYLQSGSRPVYPQAGVTSQSLPATTPSPTAAAPSASLPFYQNPFFGILGFCALVAALPVAFIGADLVRENDNLARALNKLETQNAILEAQKAPSADEGYRLAVIQQEMARMRDDVAQLGTGTLEVYYDEEDLVPVVDQGEVESQVTPDDNQEAAESTDFAPEN